MTESLHTKYRPDAFDAVIGQDAVVKPLSRMIKKREAQSYLLCGPSGTGKTTLARICAYEVGCDDKDVIEIDGATYTGIDDMRRIHEVIRFKPFGGSKARSVILDEAHRLSRNAWDSLLKVVEEPPKGVYWFFCTTEANKVPTTIKTRCASYTLKPVADKDLGTILSDVCDLEKIKLPEDVGDMIVREAHGSPRQMLQNLATCREAKSKKEAAQLLRTALESDAQLQLCRFVVDSGGSWVKVMGIVEKLQDENPEGVRINVVNYIGAALRNAKSDGQATKLLSILDNWSIPYNSSEGMAPLYQSIGRSLFSE